MRLHDWLRGRFIFRPMTDQESAEQERKITAALDDANWPTETRTIFTGSVTIEPEDEEPA